MAKHEERVLVIAFDDAPDGEDAYYSAIKGVEMPDTFVEAIKMLDKHDHVCITDQATHNFLGDAGFNSYAPYSINMNVGHYAQSSKHLYKC